MPPTTYKCVICEKEVTKRTSYQFKDGRACRIHAEVQDVAYQKQQQQVSQLQNMHTEIERAEVARAKKKQEMMLAKCFCCGKPGLHQQDFMTRVLIASKKAEIKGEAKPMFVVIDGNLCSNPEYHQSIRKYMGAPNDIPDNDYIYRCLWIVDMTKFPWLKKRLNSDAQFAVSMTKAAMVCPDCLAKHKVDLEQQRPKLTSEQLKNWAVVGAIMGGTITEMAKEQLAQEQK